MKLLDKRKDHFAKKKKSAGKDATDALKLRYLDRSEKEFNPARGFNDLR